MRATVSDVSIRRYRLSRVEYDRAVEAGAFEPGARLEVYRDPAGDGYQSVTNHAAGDKVAPLARPDAQIVVDDLLP